jgi:hypothetical protein
MAVYIHVSYLTFRCKQAQKVSDMNNTNAEERNIAVTTREK